MGLSNNNIVIIPESWDEIHKYIQDTFEHKAYATVLALMVENYTLNQFSKMGGYSFSEWKQEYLKNVKTTD